MQNESIKKEEEEMLRTSGSVLVTPSSLANDASTSSSSFKLAINASATDKPAKSSKVCAFWQCLGAPLTPATPLFTVKVNSLSIYFNFIFSFFILPQ
jgi:hypothetical protein